MSEEYENKALEIESEETELLKVLLKKEKKMLFYMRIAGVAMIVFVVAIIFVLGILVPKTVATLDELNVVIGQAEEILDETQDSIDDITDMTNEIQLAAEGINQLVDENSEVLSESMNKINNIDFDSLNQAIKDLSDVVQPLANFANKFR